MKCEGESKELGSGVRSESSKHNVQKEEERQKKVKMGTERVLLG